MCIDFQSHPQPPIGGSVRRLIEQVQKLSNQDNTIYLACDTKEEGERLSELIEEELTAPENQNTSARRSGGESRSKNSQGEIQNTDEKDDDETNS
jgi:DNA topoisomerase IA